MLSPPIEALQNYDFAKLLNGDTTPTATLRDWLIDSRRRTRLLTDDLEGARELGPRLAIVNPPLWELGHVAWFQEYWCLRFRNGAAPLSSMIENADAIYNSAIAAHDTRWDLPLLTWREMQAYRDAVLDRTIEAMERDPSSEQLRYFVLLSVLHEDMHGEAFYYTRQTLAYPKIAMGESQRPETIERTSDITFDGGTFSMGAKAGSGFAFDNEIGAHDVHVAPFSMSLRPITIGQFAEFVCDQGYARDELWDDEARRWRDACRAQAPVYWSQRGEEWFLREFDQHVLLRERVQNPMLFVNAYEAQAYCRWIGRRLPTEAEYEFAAKHGPRGGAFKSAPTTTSRRARNKLREVSDGTSANATGSLVDSIFDPTTEYHGWNWTASAFVPYPGFEAGPYKEYSEPWFGDHRTLRGCAFPTQTRLRRATYRNFYMPHRRDVLAGFRTCAV